MAILFAIAIGIIMVAYAIAYFIVSKADKLKEKKESHFGDIATIRKFNSCLKSDRHDHNMTLILNLIEGNSQMGSETLLLHPVKGYYEYYCHEDLIVFCESDTQATLKEMGYNVYENSADNLIITYDENRSQ